MAICPQLPQSSMKSASGVAIVRSIMDRRVLIRSVIVSALLAACAMPGVAPGSPERGFVVWGFLGHGTTTAASGQQATLVNASDQAVQTVTSDTTGKYVFAYHHPGNYTIRVGTLSMPVVIAGADQRLDIDLSSASGQMNYAAGAAQQAAGSTAGCPAVPAGASPATASHAAATPAAGGANPGCSRRSRCARAARSKPRWQLGTHRYAVQWGCVSIDEDVATHLRRWLIRAHHRRFRRWRGGLVGRKPRLRFKPWPVADRRRHRLHQRRWRLGSLCPLLRGRRQADVHV